MGTGQHWYVPIMVAKGVKPGKRLLLVSGVHEYNSPVDGRVAIIGTDAVRERGVDVVSILTNTDKCKDGWEYDGDE